MCWRLNIKYNLGWLLAAYDLSERRMLPGKAIGLSDMLYAQYNTENRMPVDFILCLEVKKRVVSAFPGALLLKLTTLSQTDWRPEVLQRLITKTTGLFHSSPNEMMFPGMWRAPKFETIERAGMDTAKDPRYIHRPEATEGVSVLFRTHRVAGESGDGLGGLFKTLRNGA
ncbi:hypothetical protein VM1G_11801 [Cytospora mali]|uniref:Uncharacterized protein n=1 Tax=Cytospora mali TaxID=578113 RepID=A0A194W8B7_CYTMA|nr:hypothetical protein VM1G_11801 [Valsa mali]